MTRKKIVKKNVPTGHLKSKIKLTIPKKRKVLGFRLKMVNKDISEKQEELQGLSYHFLKRKTKDLTLMRTMGKVDLPKSLVAQKKELLHFKEELSKLEQKKKRLIRDLRKLKS